jgi:hypothetical protein
VIAFAVIAFAVIAFAVIASVSVIYSAPIPRVVAISD